MENTSSGGNSEAIDQRKRRRMQSNRESARRSRQRKQEHLDELSAQAGRLREERARILAALAATARGRLAVESENAVLRTRSAELAARLQSLNDILLYLNINADADIGEPWKYQPLVNVPLAVDNMFQYC